MLWGDAADNIPACPNTRTSREAWGSGCSQILPSPPADDDSAAHACVPSLQGALGRRWANRYVEQASLLWMRRTDQAQSTRWMAYLPVGPQLKGRR